MKVRNAVCSFFPTVIMYITLFMTSSNLLNVRDLDLKGFSILLIVAIFPLLFLVQGVLTVKTRTNPIMAILVSTGGFLVVMSLFLNSSAIGYIALYGVFYLLGYVVSKVVTRNRALS